MTDANFYERIGGEATLRALVGRFYAGVATDPLLRPLYPEDDLVPAAQRLTLFLMQYWGGPTTYSDQRGHPRLRMRHAGFAVGLAERDAWLRHMRAALDSATVEPADAETMWAYFEYAADFMRNSPAVLARPAATGPSL